LLKKGVQRKSKPELLGQGVRGTQTRTAAEEISEIISSSELLLKKEVQRNSNLTPSSPPHDADLDINAMAMRMKF